MDPSNIFYLAIFTLTAAVGYGVWQYRRAARAQETGERFDGSRRK